MTMFWDIVLIVGLLPCLGAVLWVLGFLTRPLEKRDTARWIAEKQLHKPAEWGYVEVVRTILEAGCDPNTTDAKGRVPLHYALENGEVEIAEMLLIHGASLSVQDQKGETPVEALEDAFREHLLVEEDYEELKEICALYGRGT